MRGDIFIGEDNDRLFERIMDCMKCLKYQRELSIKDVGKTLIKCFREWRKSHGRCW